MGSEIAILLAVVLVVLIALALVVDAVRLTVREAKIAVTNRLRKK